MKCETAGDGTNGQAKKEEGCGTRQREGGDVMKTDGERERAARCSEVDNERDDARDKIEVGHDDGLDGAGGHDGRNESESEQADGCGKMNAERDKERGRCRGCGWCVKETEVFQLRLAGALHQGFKPGSREITSKNFAAVMCDAEAPCAVNTA